jgi:hypothetical protein
MSTLIIKLDEANTDRILDVLGDELVRGSIGEYHLLVDDDTPTDRLLATERDEETGYSSPLELLETLRLTLREIERCIEDKSLPKDETLEGLLNQLGRFDRLAHR